MQSFQALHSTLKKIDGEDYGAYQSLKGEYAYPDFTLHITQIPKDPYAPSHTGVYRIRVPHSYLGISAHLFDTKIAGIACRDFLARIFSSAAKKFSQRGLGTGYSGIITLDTPAQAILDRSAAVLTADGVEIRFFIGLPADGRKINARLAETMLNDELQQPPNPPGERFVYTGSINPLNEYGKESVYATEINRNEKKYPLMRSAWSSFAKSYERNGISLLLTKHHGAVSMFAGRLKSFGGKERWELFQIEDLTSSDHTLYIGESRIIEIPVSKSDSR
jgi:hypothetical protein